MVSLRPELVTHNKFLVTSIRSGTSEGIAIHNQPVPYSAMTREDALNLAAWLVLVADSNEEFYDFFEACQEIKDGRGRR